MQISACALFLIVYLSLFHCSALSSAKTSDVIHKRSIPHCGWGFSPPNPHDCKVVIDHQIPNSDPQDNVDFIPYNYGVPNNAQRPVILPQFFDYGDCIISVDAIEPDRTNWLMVKIAADTVIEQCVEKAMPQGGMQAVGDDGNMLVTILSATEFKKPTREENEAKIGQACEKYTGDDIHFCSDYRYYHALDGPSTHDEDQVCPQMGSFGAVYCKQNKGCCRGFTCSMKTLKAAGAAILLGIQHTLVNAAGVCIEASSA